MADTDNRPMHDEFARWYGAVSLGDDQTRLQSRWEGVCAVVESADRSTVEVLLRLAHQSRQQPEADVVEAIRRAFKAADQTFEMSGNNPELRILASICLAVLMETDEDVGAVAALTATTAEFGGARRPGISMDLGAIGETALIRLGDANRKRPSLDGSIEVPRRFGFADASTKVDEQTWESVSEAFKLAANKTRAAIKQLAETQASAIRAIEYFLRVQDEELQMLWWLTSQRSWKLDRSFEDIPADARPLVLASELAEHTQFLPGPPSVKGILSRAGLKEQGKVRIADSVNAADPAWLQRLVDNMELSFVSTPLHAAIKRQLETGAGEAWVAGWAASTGVNYDYALSGLALGNLFYRERLLLRSGDS